MSNTTTYNRSDAIELAPGIFHLGVSDENNSFANIPYLILSGDEAVVIDPGSAREEFFAVVLAKINQVLDGDLTRIKHIVVQHQDADLCAAIPLLEKYITEDCKVYAPLEAQVIIQHFGAKRRVNPLDDGDTLTFGEGRVLTFAMTPYCHFVGAMVTYDSQTKTLFSSDAFGGFSSENDLYANDNYPIQLATFLGEYLGSKRALEYALKRIEQLDAQHGIDLICPQHGCVIPKNKISEYLAIVHELEVGGQIDALAHKNGIIM